MAIFTPGPAVSQISGSAGGITFSRNAFGMYFRLRAIPVTSQTEDAIAAKNRLATASQAWSGLTDANRNAWRAWASQNPITNALGMSQILAGNMAYIQLNTILAQSGSAAISDPPVTVAPPSLLSLALTADIGTGETEIAYTATPTGANEVLVIQAAVTNSPAITYVTNLLRIVGFSGAAEASPFDIATMVDDKFGTLVVGTKLHTFVSVLNTTTGLRSLPLRSDAIVIDTP
jgi:hypothetical protein